MSVGFLSHLILPDGTLYAAFGSRNTALLYPSGIEYMATQSSNYWQLARRVRDSVVSGLAITPDQLEFDNYIRLLDDFIDAELLCENNHIAYEKRDGNDDGDHSLSNFGFSMLSRHGHKIFIHCKYGGAFCVYKEKDCVHREAGVLVRLEMETIWVQKIYIQHQTFFCVMKRSVLGGIFFPEYIRILHLSKA